MPAEAAAAAAAWAPPFAFLNMGIVFATMLLGCIRPAPQNHLDGVTGCLKRRPKRRVGSSAGSAAQEPRGCWRVQSRTFSSRIQSLGPTVPRSFQLPGASKRSASEGSSCSTGRQIQRYLPELRGSPLQGPSFEWKSALGDAGAKPLLRLNLQLDDSFGGCIARVYGHAGCPKLQSTRVVWKDGVADGFRDDLLNADDAFVKGSKSEIHLR